MDLEFFLVKNLFNDCFGSKNYKVGLFFSCFVVELFLIVEDGNEDKIVNN